MDERKVVLSDDGLNLDSSVFLQKIRQKHKEIYIILAPPRCSSTAFVRVFWEHPSMGFYCHEPFDVTYYRNFGLIHALKALGCPIKLRDSPEKNLVIKEMTFQLGKSLPLLAHITKQPLIFIIRDPRLSVWSRMKMLELGNQNPIFPFVESGWNDLESQIIRCKELNIPYLVVDSTDFRNYPKVVFKNIFEMIKLSFSEEMLSWQPREDMQLGNLGSVQSHWYQRVLKSTGIQVASEPVPEIDLFPKEFQTHVKECLEIYKNLRNERVLP